MGAVDSSSGQARGQARGETRGEATRREIIRVARRLFSEHGYHHTGISDIQTATGLTKGAFYHHFRTKEALALAVLELARADYGEHLFGPVASIASPGRRAAALLEAALDLNRRPQWCNCRMMATLIAELTVADERLHGAVLDMQKTMFEGWRDLLAEAQRAGEANAAIDPGVGAQLILNAMTGGLMTRKIGNEQAPLEAVIEVIKQTLLTDAVLQPPVEGPADPPA